MTDSSGTITLSGNNSAVNIFDVPGSDLNSAHSLTMIAPADSLVLINVSGTNETLENFGITLDGVNSQEVLWNYSQATSLSINGFQVDGSLLAPNAAVNFSNGQIDGTLVADSVTGSSGELHNFPLVVSCPSVVSGTYAVTVNTSLTPNPTPQFFVVDGTAESIFAYNSAGESVGSAALERF